MTPVVLAVSLNDSARKVITQMVDKKVHRLFVVDGSDRFPKAHLVPSLTYVMHICNSPSTIARMPSNNSVNAFLGRATK